jgi:hypothetical protein
MDIFFFLIQTTLSTSLLLGIKLYPHLYYYIFYPPDIMMPNIAGQTQWLSVSHGDTKIRECEKE